MPLNDRQQRFVLEYLLDLNATQAAIRAGYSKKTAASQGQRLLTNAEVQAAVLDAKKKRAERTELTAEWVLRRLQEEAEQRGEGSSHSARVRALELIGKHLDIFEDRFRLLGTGNESDEPTPYEKRLAQFRERYGGGSADANAGREPAPPAPGNGGQGGGAG